MRIIIVYRPPVSVTNGLTHAAFFDEFSMLLERLMSSPGKFTLKWRFQFPAMLMIHLTAPQVNSWIS